MFLSFDPHGNVTETGVANGLNQLTQYAAKTLSHDAKGNVTAFGADTFTYSSENLMTSATVAATSTTLANDPMHRLYQLSSGGAVQRFAFDGLNALSEHDGADALLRIAVLACPPDRLRSTMGLDPTSGQPVVQYEGTGVAAADRRYMAQDERGSVISMSDSNGASLGINTYDEYGNPGGALTGRYGYTGQAWIPSAGLWYLNARMYSGAIGGRFLQTDPVGYEGGINLYAYVEGDPVDLTDPSGETWVYSQSTGQVVHVDNSTNVVTPLPGPPGYSGYDIYANKPAFQNLPNKGPIPTGKYNIGPLINRITANAMRLTPQPGTNTFGRSGFLIHGGHRNGDRRASEGCIILQPNQRLIIGRSGDHELLVIEGPPPSTSNPQRNESKSSDEGATYVSGYTIDALNITGNRMKGTRIGCPSGERTC